MADVNGDFPTIVGTDARFKGEMTFEKGVRIDGCFEGNIRSKGTLHIAEGAKVAADVEAANVKVEGECKGNLIVSDKLHLLPTARVEGDLRTNRLEISDGAMFTGHVVTGQAAAEKPFIRPGVVAQQHAAASQVAPNRPGTPQPVAPGQVRPHAQDVRIQPGNP